MNFNKKYLWGLIPLLLVGVLLYYFSDIVIYIALAWVVSMIGNPLMQFLKKYVNKNIAAVLTLSTFVLVLTVLVSIFIPPLMTQAKNLAKIDYKNVAQTLEEPLEDWRNWLVEKGLILDEEIADTFSTKVVKSKEERVVTQWVNLDSLKVAHGDTTRLDGSRLALIVNVNHPSDDPLVKEEPEEHQSFFENAQANIVQFLNPRRITGVFSSVIGFFSNLLIAVMSILFISFFFLREQGLFDRMLASVVPNEYEVQTVQAINESSKMLIRYFLGVLTQITVITIFVSLVLTFLGVKNALLIAFFAALMNVIPYVGPLFGATFGAIITISSNLDLPFYSAMLPLLIKVLAVIAIMQLLDNFILQPTIFGRSIKAHPLEIFIVVLIGAKLGGILGMVVAIPAYTILRVIGKVFFSEFKVVQRITAGL